MSAQTLGTAAVGLICGLALSPALARPLAWVWSGRSISGAIGVPLADKIMGRLAGGTQLRQEGARQDGARQDGEGQDGVAFTLRLVAFNAFAFLALYGVLRAQGLWGELGSLSPDVALRVAVSALTDTNWGGSPAPGEDPSRSFAFLVRIFVAGGTSLAVAAALARAFASPGRADIGDFWGDVVRNGLIIVAPLAAVTLAATLIARWLDPERLSWFGPAAAGSAVNAVRFACPLAFGEMIKSRSDGRVLLVITVLLTIPGALLTVPTGGGFGADVAAPADPVALFQSTLCMTALAGAGPGLAGPLVLAILAAGVGGMLIGRTPEYIGKRLHAREIRLCLLASLALSVMIVAFAAISAFTPEIGRAELGWNGLWPDAAYQNTVMSVAMFLGRFGVAVPIVALAGGLARKPRRAATAGVVITDGAPFVAFLVVAAVVLALMLSIPGGTWPRKPGASENGIPRPLLARGADTPRKAELVSNATRPGDQH